MTPTTHAAPADETEQDAGLERLKLLEEQLAPAPANSRKRRALKAAIRIEATAYRKSLDADQAAATHDREIPDGAIGQDTSGGSAVPKPVRPIPSAGSGDGRRR